MYVIALFNQNWVNASIELVLDFVSSKQKFSFIIFVTTINSIIMNHHNHYHHHHYYIFQYWISDYFRLKNILLFSLSSSTCSSRFCIYPNTLIFTRSNFLNTFYIYETIYTCIYIHILISQFVQDRNRYIFARIKRKYSTASTHDGTWNLTATLLCTFT